MNKKSLDSGHLIVFIVLYLFLTFFSIISYGGFTNTSLTLWIRNDIFDFISVLISALLMFFVVIQIQDSRDASLLTQKALEHQISISNQEKMARIITYTNVSGLIIINAGKSIAYDIEIKILYEAKNGDLSDIFMSTHIFNNNIRYLETSSMKFLEYRVNIADHLYALDVEKLLVEVFYKDEFHENGVTVSSWFHYNKQDNNFTRTSITDNKDSI